MELNQEEIRSMKRIARSEALETVREVIFAAVVTGVVSKFLTGADTIHVIVATAISAILIGALLFFYGYKAIFMHMLWEYELLLESEAEEEDNSDE